MHKMKNEILFLFLLSLLNLNAQTEKKKLNSSGINSIEISHFSEVFYRQSDKAEILIEYDTEVSNFIKIKQNSDKISIDLVLPNNLNLKYHKKILQAKHKVFVNGNFDVINDVKTFYAGRVNMNIESQSKLSLFFNACGIIKGKLSSEISKINAQVSNLKISGNTKSLHLVSYGSNFNAFNLACEKILVDSEGSVLNVFSTNKVEVQNLKRSVLNYKGKGDLKMNPNIIIKQSTINKS